MEVVHEPEALRMACDQARSRGARVALVPTMGALHEGHARLVEVAKSHGDFVVLTIFVNPTQFAPGEDLARYPRTLEADLALAAMHGASLVFAPNAAAMYPAGDETRVSVGPTASALCGEHRAGHFEGVATVVSKLFALVGPSVACFGRKDYQQLCVIKRLTRDLFFPIDVIGVPTVRESDGLALSSRNRYLDADARKAALSIPRGLSRAAALFRDGERGAYELEQACRAEVAPVADRIDYVTLADPDTVSPYVVGQQVGERALLALAVRLGATRLIDNLVLGEDAPPLEVW